MAASRTVLSAKTRKTIDAVETGAEIHPRKIPSLFEGLRDDVAQVDKAELSFAELTRLLDTSLSLGDLILRTYQGSKKATTAPEEKPEPKNNVEILASRIASFVALNPERAYRSSDFNLLVQGFNVEFGLSNGEVGLRDRRTFALSYLVEKGQLTKVKRGALNIYLAPSPASDQALRDIELPPAPITRKSPIIPSNRGRVRSEIKNLKKDQLLCDLYQILEKGPASGKDLKEVFVQHWADIGLPPANRSAARQRFSVAMAEFIKAGKIVRTGSTNSTRYRLPDKIESFDKDTSDTGAPTVAESGTPDETSPIEPTSKFTTNNHIPQSDSDIAVAFSESLVEGLFLDATETDQIDNATQSEVLVHDLASQTEPTYTHTAEATSHTTLQDIAPVISTFEDSTDPAVDSNLEQDEYDEEPDQDTDTNDPIPLRRRRRFESVRQLSTVEQYLGIHAQLHGDFGTLLLDNDETVVLTIHECKVLLGVMRPKNQGTRFNDLLKSMQKSGEYSGTTLHDTIDSLNATSLNTSAVYIEATGSQNPTLRLQYKPETPGQIDVFAEQEFIAISDSAVLPSLIAYIQDKQDYDEQLDSVIEEWTTVDAASLLACITHDGIAFDAHTIARIRLILSSAPKAVQNFGIDLLKKYP